MSSRSCLMFLMQCARCHWTEAQSSAVTTPSPGSGSSPARRARRARTGTAGRWEADRGLDAHGLVLLMVRMAVGRAGAARRLCDARLVCQSRRRSCGESNDAPQYFPSQASSSEGTSGHVDLAEPSISTAISDPTGLHRVLDDGTVLPQAAQRLDTRRELWPDEVRIRVERLNLDAASFRQLERTHRRRGRRTPRGPGHRRHPRQDAEPRDRLRRHAGRHRRGGRPRVAARARGRRPRRHPGQPDPRPRW